MTDTDEFLIATIDDYLLSIADGIQLAQSKLDQLPTTSAVSQTPSHTYYIPKIDFELKMTVSIEERTRENVGGVRPTLMMRPVQKEELEQVNAQAVSTLRGSFVAMPITQPQAPITAISYIRINEQNKPMIGVEIKAVGGNVKGHEVHFNVDRDLSRIANADIGLNAAPKLTTMFVDPVVYSNDNGIAQSQLFIDPEEPDGLIVVLALDVAGQTELIHFGVSGGV